MPRYRGDPYITTAKYGSICPICRQRINPDDKITIWPRAKRNEKARHWKCSEKDYLQFLGAAQDEEIMTRGFRYGGY